MISGDPWYKIVFIAMLLSTDIIRSQLYYTHYIRRNQVSENIFSISAVILLRSKGKAVLKCISKPPLKMQIESTDPRKFP